MVRRPVPAAKPIPQLVAKRGTTSSFMETLEIHRKAARRAPGEKSHCITGVVASGNLEVLLERVLGDNECEVKIKTSVKGFGEVWRAVVNDFVERYSPGGL